jgi:hypothetical protein
MVGLIVVLFIYDDDIILLAKTIGDLHKKLKALHEFYEIYELAINNDRNKIMIIKCKKIIIL